MAGFTIQEFVISGLYIWYTADILKTLATLADDTHHRKRTIRMLLAITAAIFAMDTVLL